MEEGVTPSEDVPVEPTAATAPLRPAGTPVTDHLAIIDEDARAKFGDETLEAIDSAHGDGGLPRMRAYEESPGKNIHGSYTTKMSLDVNYNLVEMPDEILISPTTPHPHMTFAHETGHYIDDWGFGVEGWASEESATMHKWREAVKGSDAFGELNDRKINPDKYVTRIKKDGKTFRLSTPEKYLDYTQQEREVWARSYSQYVAEKSTSSALKSELSTMLSEQKLPLQWQADDFAPIKDAIDEVFKERGWLG